MNGHWDRVQIAGHPADVYTPAGVARPNFAILFLHGIGMETLRDNAAFTRVFDGTKLGCISPIGEKSWWVDRICTSFDRQLTPEKHVLQNVVPHFQQLWGIAPPRIGLLGISMGGQAVLRLAFKYPKLFPVAAGISSAIDCHEAYGQKTELEAMYDSKEQCRQDTAPMHIHPSEYPPYLFFCIDPSDWPWFRGNDRLHEKLSALGIAHTHDLVTQAGGHSWEYFDRMADRAIRFIHEGLTSEARRLM